VNSDDHRVFTSFVVVRVTRTEDVTHSHIRGIDRSTSHYEIVQLEVVPDERDSTIRIGNDLGRIFIRDGFRLQIQEPEMLGKIKVGMKLDLVLREETK
jgi:hypothetical protein